MTSLAYNRRKLVGWGVAVLVVAGAVWYVRSFRPAAEALASRMAVLAEREGRVRQARAASVEVGQAGLDSLLARFESDSALLATRVPPAGDAASVAGEIKDALVQAERETGVRMTLAEPLPPNPDAPFESGGYAVRAVGRYADVGALLARLATLPRLTKVQGLRLHAVPDSLVRSVASIAGAAPGVLAADSAGVAAAMADAGETPFTAVAMFTLRWYTLPPSTADSLDSVPGFRGGGGAP